MPVVPILTRVGSKKPIRDLVKRKSPSDYTFYIEPFVGSGAVYFYLDIGDTPAVISDLDSDLINAHKIIKSNPSIDNLSKYENMTDSRVDALINKKRTNGSLEKLAQYTARTSGTFGGKPAKADKKGNYKVYKYADISTKLKRIPDNADYMKNTLVLNQDYKTVIKKYDRAGAFIYLDPPYQDSNGLYDFPDMDFEEMADVLAKVKGKFLMSINDSPEIRKIFKRFKISKVVVRGGGGSDKEGVIGAGSRNELFIYNY